MNINEIQSKISLAIRAAYEGGLEILKVYGSDFAVEHKEDKTPLTLADKHAHQAICAHLETTGIPILSEEGKKIEFAERNNWEYFWMIDPLDGTKEFVKRNGEFTVNIALIHNGTPIGGVIYVPVKNTLYFSIVELGSYKIDHYKGGSSDFETLTASAKALPAHRQTEKYTIVASRSHMSAETEALVKKLEAEHGEVEVTSMGSSLKICLVAEGAANIYPRFAPTMEWDTAAGHAIASGAGKQVTDHSTGAAMRYNKENLLNNWFIVQ